MTVKVKKARTRKAGYRGVMNAQDFPSIEKTPQLRRQRLRESATQFLGMMRVWGTGRQCEVIVRAAVLNLIDTLDKEPKV